MKKILMMFMLVISFQPGKTQNYLGLSRTQILSDTTLKDEVASDSLVDGSPFLIIRNQGINYLTKRYFFDKVSQRCYMYVVEPADKEALNNFIKFCDENYTSIGEKRWKTQVNGFQVSVSLEKGSASELYYFFFETRGEANPHR
jgi:hypothetical protein